MKKHHNLIVDINNYTFMMRHAKLRPVSSHRKKERNAVEVIFIETVKSIINRASILGVDSLVICRDSRDVWRKDIYEAYKANHLSSIEDPYYEDVIKAIDLMCEFFQDYTAAAVLSVPRCEADDIVAVWCQESTGVHNTILSSDQDFVQLIDEDTELYSPSRKDFIRSENPAYDLFVKCIRGDRGDNIFSAYPRVREDRLARAWDDPIEMMNVLEHLRKDGKRVGDVLESNIDLIDLSCQPPYIRADIVDAINRYTPSVFSKLKAIGYFATGVGLRGFSDVIDRNGKLLSTPSKFSDK